MDSNKNSLQKSVMSIYTNTEPRKKFYFLFYIKSDSP